LSFIETILTHTKESESPRRYYYWATLAAIACVVRDQVWLDKFMYKLYPNIYVLIVGKSGLRKGPPVNLAKALVKAIDNTKIITGRASIQAVIAELARAYTRESGGVPLTGAAAGLFSSEFASFLISDPQALTILTDLYDGHYNPEWVNMTKISGQEKLKAPCITMLGASNEIHLKDAIPDNAMGGGFLARTFIIYADKKSSVNPLLDKPTGLLPWDTLVSQLRAISQTKGEFTWTPEGKELYRAWYSKFSEQDNSDDNTGTLERIHDHILKTAMLISLSRKPDLELRFSDIEEAIRACQDFVPGAKRVALGQVGKSISAPGTAVLLRELILNAEHQITRTAALRKFWQHFDSFELDRIAESLEAQRAISLKPHRNGTEVEIMYVLNPKVLENYLARNTKDNKTPNEEVEPT
jgi:hypothetical protein